MVSVARASTFVSARGVIDGTNRTPVNTSPLLPNGADVLVRVTSRFIPLIVNSAVPLTALPDSLLMPDEEKIIPALANCGKRQSRNAVSGIMIRTCFNFFKVMQRSLVIGSNLSVTCSTKSPWTPQFQSAYKHFRSPRNRPRFWQLGEAIADYSGCREEEHDIGAIIGASNRKTLLE
jgi:hypothetical protein